MGFNGIRTMLELVATAYALVQGCHLGHVKAYNLKFLGLISTRLDADLGLRHVNVLEAQAADRMLWGTIADLTTDKGWNLNDSLHEVTVLRSDMIGLLQPRPKAIQRYHNSDIPAASNAKGKGRGTSKSKKGSSSANPKWVFIHTNARNDFFHLHEISIWKLHQFQLPIQTRLCGAKIRWYSMWGQS